MLIREANIDDAETVGYVHYTAWKQAYKDMFSTEYLEADTPANRAQEFRVSLQSKDIHYFVIAGIDSIIGIMKVVVSESDSCELASIYILNEHRKKGYGGQAISYIENLYSNKNIFLWVLENNIGAIRFYERNGFQATGKTRVINRGSEFLQLQYLRSAVNNS